MIIKNFIIACFRSEASWPSMGHRLSLPTRLSSAMTSNSQENVGNSDPVAQPQQPPQPSGSSSQSRYKLRINFFIKFFYCITAPNNVS